MIAELQKERRDQIRALLTNSAYVESDEGISARKKLIDELNDHFDKAVDAILDPHKSEREDAALRANPLFAAGMRGLEKLKWDMHNAALKKSLEDQGLTA